MGDPSTNDDGRAVAIGLPKEQLWRSLTPSSRRRGVGRLIRLPQLTSNHAHMRFDASRRWSSFPQRIFPL